MRTSRISRETARVIETLSLPRLPATRRSLRNHRQDPDTLCVDNDKHGTTTPNSEDAQSTASSALGKRKRHDGGTVPSASSKASATPPRRSPRKSLKAEVASDDDNASSKVIPQRKPRKHPAKHVKGLNGTISTEPPLNWEEVYSVTAAMRKRVFAPVDTMGCESLAEKQRSPRDQRLQTLISLMLSSQTKDTVTAAAMRNLQQNLPGGFTLDSLLAVDPVLLNNLIEKVGFHNNKTKFIKSVAEILRERFNGDIPDTIEGLVSLPGVGPKMAYLCMSAAWGRDEGIGVDVHVHRITNLWGWHKTSTPEQTRAELEAWLPRDKWHDINHLLVGLGQTICLPVGRKCGECDLASKKLCPSAVPGSPVKRRVKRDLEIKADGGDVVKDHVIKVEYDEDGAKLEASVNGRDQVEIQTSSGPMSS